MGGSSALERPTGFTRMHGRSSNVPLLDCQPSTLRIKSLVGIQEAVDMEELNTDGWRHMPETDQIVSVDPMDM